MFRIALGPAVLCALLCGAVASANDCTTDFAPIVARGRMLAAYDVASRGAYLAIRGENPPREALTRSIARQTETGWTVAFGRLADGGDKFLIFYEATQRASPTDFAVQRHVPPAEDTGYYFFAAKAIETALAAFPAADHPYNTFVLPAEAKQMYVYFEPAITRKDSIPLGGDTRYLLSPDGTKIIETRRMHASIIDKSPPQDGKQPAGGFHTHILSDSPEDSDVFYVLRQHPPLPEYIGTAHKCTYAVNADGSIKSLK